MTKYTKAALLSGLVFPGLGQIYLKQYLRGFAIILIMVSSLSSIIVMVTISALKTIRNLQNQGSADIAIASSLITSAATDYALFYNISLMLIVCCWIFSIVDASRLGKRKDA